MDLLERDEILNKNKKVLTIPEFWEWRKAELEKGRRILVYGTSDENDVLCYEFLSVNKDPRVVDENESLVVVYNQEIVDTWVKSVFENLPYNPEDYTSDKFDS